MFEARRVPVDEPDAAALDERVLAIDNVPLDLPVAGAGSRSLAAFVDYLVVTAASIVLSVAAFFAGVGFGLKSMWWLAVILFGLFALQYGYFAGCEILMDGQTIGKQVVGLRVVSRHGSRPSRVALLIRNALRSLDIVVGVPMMIFDPLSRRLGDRLAGTVVIRQVSAAAAKLTLLQRVPRGWTARQIEVLESFLVRSEELRPETAERLAVSLVAAIERDDPAFFAPDLQYLSPIERLRAGVARSDGA
jgi:uncharacterized RDD family membrane protein YckC